MLWLLAAKKKKFLHRLQKQSSLLHQLQKLLLQLSLQLLTLLLLLPLLLTQPLLLPLLLLKLQQSNSVCMKKPTFGSAFFRLKICPASSF